jgi:hypothetical protein
MSRKAALALGAAIAAFGWVKSSIAATIAGWTFETSPPGGAGTQVAGATFGPQAADIGTGSASGVHAGSTSQWSNPAGNGSNESFSSNVWAAGDYYEFQVNSTGLEDIMVSFDQTRSGTGPNFFDITYSADGTNFTSAGSYTLAGTTWSTASAATVPGNSFSFDLSTVSALENDPSIFIRLVNTSSLNATGGTLPTAGTSRLDNVFITGTPIPEPAALGLMSVAAAAGMVRNRSRKTVKA